MPLRKPMYDTGSRNIFPFSMEGCVLYLPLYQVDMQGTPLISYDQYHHSCDVTGAVYILGQGRDFDQTDDDINCGSSSVLDNIWDGGGTVISWINPNSDGESSNGVVAAKRRSAISTGWSIHLLGESGGSSWIGLYCYFNTTSGYWRSTNLTIPNGSKTCIGITYNSSSVVNAPLFYINGLSVAVTVAGTPVGTRVSDAALDLLIGDNEDSSGCFDGVNSEVIAYKKILTPAENLYYYNNSYPRRLV